MNKLAITLALAAATFGATAVHANDSGPYVGGGFGQFNLEVENLSDAGQAAQSIVDSDDSSWKLFAGWRFNRFLALEAAYINLGDLDDRFTASGSNGRYRAKLDGFSPSLIGTIPLPLSGLEIFGKVGYYIYDVDLSTNLGNPGSSFVNSSHSRSDLMYGAGLGYTFLGRLNVRAEYERFDLENYKDSNAIWLSAAFRF